MTAHEYLRQYKTCERQIRFNFMQIENLKALTYTISSPSWGERVSGTRSTDPPFVKALERYWEQEEELKRQNVALEQKKAEIIATINALENEDEKFILLHRYVNHMTWEDIGLELLMSERNVRRFSKTALEHIVVPS
jgi:DNA-directed RNA polymerase specialized sigma subunit